MIEELLAAAKAARSNAYAPYSNYKVGAAIRSESNIIYAGCNVENAVYPLGQCAERVAIQAMVRAGETRIAELLLLTENGETPCGACRQVMTEFAHDSMQIYLANGGSVVQETTLGALLPRAFRLR